jgi:hypothetical protein
MFIALNERLWRKKIGEEDCCGIKLIFFLRFGLLSEFAGDQTHALLIKLA